MSTPLKTARMTPSTDLQGVEVRVDTLYLDDLPKAMDNMGWTVSAQLMRRWFATKPAWVMPLDWRRGVYENKQEIDYTKLPSSQVDDQIVKMAWALKYPKVKAVFDDLKAHWASEKGREEIGNCLLKTHWKKAQGTPMNLGATNMPAKQLDRTSQVNARGLGGLFDTLDDYFGAIFKATLKVAVVGTAYHDATSNKDLFKVEHLGFYIRDTYDFNSGWFEDQFMGLGVWSKQRVLSKAEMVHYKSLSNPAYPPFLLQRHLMYPSFVQVRNTDFRRWQIKRKEGGDFFVFSDVLWEPYHGEPIEIIFKN